MEAYPKCKYPSDPDKQPCVVADADAEKALGEGYYDSPTLALAARTLAEVKEAEADATADSTPAKTTPANKRR